MGVVSKYGNLYDVKKNIICHAPVTSSHFGRLLKKGNELPKNMYSIIRDKQAM